MKRAALIGSCFAFHLSACAVAPSAIPPPTDQIPAVSSSLADSLLSLAQTAFDDGDLVTAEDRYRRALSAQPDSVPARVGLSRIAVERSRPEDARKRLEDALRIEPEYVDALLMLARIERGGGGRERARELLERAIRSDPKRPDSHAALAELTGMAPRGLSAGPEQRLERSDRYPYDPRAALDAARVLLGRGREQAAVKKLDSAWRLADLDPAAGLAAAALLGSLGERDAPLRVVPVHCYADETVRSRPGWRMRLRMIWAGATTTLEPVVDTLFVPVLIAGFNSTGFDARLNSLERAFQSTVGSAPAVGLIALFSERGPPRRRGSWRLGQAGFLGRTLVARLDPEELVGRTLIHELLHLYGGVHIAPDSDSLMNPSGTSNVLDPVNARIAWLLRDRHFGPGGIRANVLPFVDIRALTVAYKAALKQNLTSRRLGIADALEAGRASRFVAAQILRETAALDEHLANVCHFVAALLIEQERGAQAVRLLETAAVLYGPRSKRGGEALLLAEKLRLRDR